MDLKFKLYPMENEVILTTHMFAQAAPKVDLHSYNMYKFVTSVA